MPHTRYLIIGGGMTADAAVHGIRTRDKEGEIALISAEADPPYNRPPLSKGLWKGKPLDGIWRRSDDQRVTMHLGRTVRGLDLARREATDDLGAAHRFDRLLLATGGTPRRLPFGGDGVIYFRTLADYRRLRALAAPGKRFAVIGGGFIGSEIAAALAGAGAAVTMVFPDEAIGARLFPRDLALFVSEYYRGKGVDVRAGEKVTGIVAEGGRFAVETRGDDDGGAPRRLAVDGVVAGLGIKPSTELAEGAGLAVDDGVVVDEQLRASHPDVWAAGDVAAFASPALGRRIRVEHEDNALAQGSVAGENMAGAGLLYHHLPFFYSDLFELGYEAVGEVDSRLETVADWHVPMRKGVVYYLREGRVRGVLLWDVWGKVDAARELIAAAGRVSAGELAGRIRP
ncbi:MAG TPA: FAD/NAD(P)-binding oxidoreductase [Thermoanaerobaculaceae bacterium]|nr:FAD/NAD(P)-binding oxidoreductase [Thermoanaerobaculaceae bacterium]